MTKSKLQLLQKLKNFSLPSNQIFALSAATIVVVIFSFSLWGEDGLLRLLELKQLRNQIAEENKSMLLENLSYTQEIANLKKTTTIEQVARSELGMIRDDEVILLFPKTK